MDKSQIIDHIMSTPYNINWNVLSTMLGDGDWSKLKAYVEQTSHNMNRKVLEVFLDSGPRIAVVGTAIVGQDVVG